MTDITGAREKIQVEAVDSSSPISEDLMTKIGGAVNYIIDNSATQLGDVISSTLTEAQFQTLRGNNWIQFNGQDITGSDYANLTGINTMPVQYGGGALVNAPLDGDLMTADSGQNKSHAHDLYYQGLSGNAQHTLPSSIYSVSSGYQDSLPEGGLINRAGGVRVRFYMKYNNESS